MQRFVAKKQPDPMRGRAHSAPAVQGGREPRSRISSERSQSLARSGSREEDRWSIGAYPSTGPSSL